MSVVERDEKRTQLSPNDHDVLKAPQLRAVVDPMSEEWLAIDDPNNENEEEWIESDQWVGREEMR
jgi:hypothetical protein